MSDDFYRAFEEKYRGSRELIKSRQRVYLPFIEPLRSIYNDAKAIDLGCGRGEWLELLKESGFDAQGVDLDDGMLAACRELGLNVATADALAALKALPDASQMAVSGFHIAEHIQFSDLQTLVQEALRVLKPAGLLILETPNPENIVVGSCTFYLDPTHRQPIPSQLLSFLPEHYGFARTKILRLQESVDLSGERVLSLKDVLSGVSPDYAVVAQKTADESILTTTSQAFEPEYGISLEALADKYDRQAEAIAHAAEARAQQAETIAHAAETRALQAETIAHAAETRALQAETIAHAAETRALQAETIAHAAETRALQAETIAHAAETRALQAETIAHAAESRAQQAETIAHAAETRALQAETIARAAESRAQQAETIAHAAETDVLQAHALHAVYNSRSWRITAPCDGVDCRQDNCCNKASPLGQKRF
ncbi:methyltransferase domain-containing protein [Polaromonas sp. P1-6]|nr:methyltransferase domain-containing protein [Polaromonas sp. P1-6]